MTNFADRTFFFSVIFCMYTFKPCGWNLSWLIGGWIGPFSFSYKTSSSSEVIFCCPVCSSTYNSSSSRLRRGTGTLFLNTLTADWSFRQLFIYLSRTCVRGPIKGASHLSASFLLSSRSLLLLFSWHDGHNSNTSCDWCAFITTTRHTFKRL